MVIIDPFLCTIYSSHYTRGPKPDFDADDLFQSCSENNDEVEIIRSNKGGLKLIHRGYMYTVHKKRLTGGIRWRCSRRSLHCKVYFIKS